MDIEELSVTKLLEAGKAQALPFDHPQGGKGVILPEGYTVAHLAEPARKLHHIMQGTAMLDAPSLAAYVNRFKTPRTQIFADYRKPLVVAVIDYHDAPDLPAYCEHRAHYQPPWSEQWSRWQAIDGKALDQGTYAEFIEENYPDVASPPAAELLDVVVNLQAKKNVDFQSGIRLHDGTTQLTYHESIESKGKGTLKVPAEFELGVPVFFGAQPYRVRCLLRYRISEGRLAFIVKINRRGFIEHTAFEDVVKAIGEATAIEPYRGSL